MTDYKHTLNLPKTKFPMKGNLSQREPEILERWNKAGLYQQIRQQRAGKPRFILHDGPPYANGDIHIGHAVNKILKDIIIKSKTLSGLDAPYIPGWDCHGLPIELNVEKKIGKPGVKVSASDFRKACRKYAQQQVDKQRTDFIRLGILGEWQQPYYTMDPLFEADTVRALAKIIENGHLIKGHKPVHWCLDCGSALAEAEVEYADKTSKQIDVRFAIADRSTLKATFPDAPDKPIALVIWTTTPWTLPANQAVAVHAELDYALVDTGDECLLLADKLITNCTQRYGIKEYSVVGSTSGKQLAGYELQHPFYNKVVPVVLSDHVTTDAGTGAVHIAPGHGQDDYIVGRKYNLEIYNPVDGNGIFVPGTEYVEGMHVNKVNSYLIELMQEKGSLLQEDNLQHSYPHCWRHKTPIIFRATPQWFIGMQQNELRDKAMQAIADTEWMPNWGRARIESMVHNRPDWCISRQRTWGVPIPLFIHKETEALHPDTTQLIEQVAQKIEHEGIDAWYSLDSKELLGADNDNYVQVNDTLDVWFDSGVTHSAVLARRTDELRSPPADLYLEGSDQHRGWFQSSLLTAIGIRDQAPYKSVLTHGFTVDAQGRKMSKSLGNVISPQKICKTMGADIIRLWIAATDYSSEMNVSDEILKRVADSYRRMRNTIRYLLANLDGFNPQTDLVDSTDMLALDKWVLGTAKDLQAEITNAYNDYQFHKIYQLIHNFCTVEMGGFYLDVIKDRQYTMQTNSRARRSAQTAMYHIAEAMVRWLAPIISFTADEIWQYIPGDRSESVFTASWYKPLAEFSNTSSFNNDFWRTVLSVRTAISKQLEALREAGEIGSSLNAEVDIYCEEKLFEQLKSLEDELRFILITSYARINAVDEKNQDAVECNLESGESFWVNAQASKHPKCVRCWHQREDVGVSTEHPELCGRCIDNVSGTGEIRLYA